MTVLQKFQAIQNIGTEVEVPFAVWSLFGSNSKIISLCGDQICLGEDFVEPHQVREALQWYVEQLGGTVKWTKV